jgi:homoserine trans-succinylase
VKFVQPVVDMIRPVLPEIDTDDVRFLSVKESAEVQVKINFLIRSGEELNWFNLTTILGCKHLSHLYLTMIELKEDFMDCMIISDAPKSYLNGERIDGEGFVLKNDKMILKIIDRPVFAHANFNLQRSR